MAIEPTTGAPVKFILRPRVLISGILLSSALLFACMAANQRLGRDAPPPSAPASVPVAATASPPAPTPRFNFETFSPLLAEPELKRVNELMRDGLDAQAASVLEAQIERRRHEGRAAARRYMLLARLHERAGNEAQAEEHYVRAAANVWPLADYAQLGAGRMLVRQGQFERGVQTLSRVSAELPIAAEAQLLTAEAEAARGNYDRAAKIYRVYAASSATTALQLARALIRLPDADGVAVASDAASVEDLLEALHWVRQARASSVSGSVERQAQELEVAILNALPASQRHRHASPSRETVLTRARTLVEARSYDSAEPIIDHLLAGLEEERFGQLGCEAYFLRAKVMAGQREWGKAAESLADALRFCEKDPEIMPKMLFVAGKYAAADARHAQAIRHYDALQKSYPEHRLSDDARLRAAKSYLKLGVEARFTELLSSMPDDYPQGDMLLDGIFELALRRIEKNDWGGAAAVLERAKVFVSENDSARGTEFSGRERYFLARAWMRTGERERGLQQLEALVRDVPFSYYMLHAYSGLKRADPERAQKAREEALSSASKEPFSFVHRPEYETPQFERAVELLSIADFRAAWAELEALKLTEPSAAPGALWAIALLFDRAGAPNLSHSVARGLLTDWLERWPAGQWAQAWRIAFPTPHPELVRENCIDKGVPLATAYAVMREESAFDAKAESPAHAYGLMQLIVPTARAMAKPLGLSATPAALKRPSVNIALGCRFLGILSRRFDENPLLAIPGYNAGPGRPSRWAREQPTTDFDVWVEQIPFRETRRYTKRVLASRAAYAWLYDSDNAEAALVLPERVLP